MNYQDKVYALEYLLWERPENLNENSFCEIFGGGSEIKKFFHVHKVMSASKLTEKLMEEHEREEREREREREEREREERIRIKQIESDERVKMSLSAKEIHLRFSHLYVGNLSLSSQNSRSTTPRSKFRTQSEILYNRAIDVYYLKNKVTSSDEFESMVATMADSFEAHDLVDIIFPSQSDREALSSFDEVTRTQHRISINQASLNLLGERQYQRQFSASVLDHLHVIDSHSKMSSTPLFSGAEDGIFWCTAQPDLMMRHAPVMLEFKNKYAGKQNVDDVRVNDSLWDGLQQSIDRILTTSAMCAYISLIIVFVVTGTACMVVVYRRQLGGDFSPQEVVHVYRISSAALHTLWEDLSLLSAIKPAFFFSPHAQCLIETIRALGFSPEICRTKLLKHSRSAVYGVTFPQTMSRGKRSDIGVESATVHLAIKISDIGREFFSECELLKQISATNHSTKATLKFYAQGQYHNGEMSWYPNYSIELPSPPQFQCVQKGEAWWAPLWEYEETHGAILMIPGQHRCSIDESNWREAVSGVIKSLRLAHQAGIVHRDIRKQNIVLFDDGWQLIDFDLACRSGVCVTLHRSDNQFKCAGEFVHTLTNVDEYQWTVDDDYDMLFSLVKSLADVGNKKVSRRMTLDGSSR